MLYDYLAQNHDTLLYIIAGAALIIELTLIGLSGPLLFFSLGSALTGILISLGIISGWELEIVFVALLTLTCAFVFWKPLKAFQGKAHVADNSSDLIGQCVDVSEDVSVSSGSVRYSGINWTARLPDNSTENLIKKSSRVKIIAINGNILIVEQAISPIS